MKLTMNGVWTELPIQELDHVFAAKNWEKAGLNGWRVVPWASAGDYLFTEDGDKIFNGGGMIYDLHTRWYRGGVEWNPFWHAKRWVKWRDTETGDYWARETAPYGGDFGLFGGDGGVPFNAGYNWGALGSVLI